MHRYKIVPWILLILSIISVTLAAPAVLREIRHARADVMDVREGPIPVSRSEKQNDELDELWDEPSSAVHPRGSTPQPESDYESAKSALGSPNSFQAASPEAHPATPEIQTLPGESSVKSVILQPAIATPRLGPSNSDSQKSFLSKLVSKSKSFFSKVASMSKNFFGKLAGKVKFWRRTSESVSA